LLPLGTVRSAPAIGVLGVPGVLALMVAGVLAAVGTANGAVVAQLLSLAWVMLLTLTLRSPGVGVVSVLW